MESAPGRTAVVVGENGRGYGAALDLMDAGVSVAAVVDSGPPGVGNEAAQAVLDRGARVLHGRRAVKALGRGRVKGVEIATIGGDGNLRIRIQCDLICMAGTVQPADALLHQAGGSSRFTGSSPIPDKLPKNVLTAGHVTGEAGVAEGVLQGRNAGAVAAAELTGMESVPPEAPTDGTAIHY